MRNENNETMEDFGKWSSRRTAGICKFWKKTYIKGHCVLKKMKEKMCMIVKRDPLLQGMVAPIY